MNPYKCSHCVKALLDNTHLTKIIEDTHWGSHTNAAIFINIFHKIVILKSHMRTKTGEHLYLVITVKRLSQIIIIYWLPNSMYFFFHLLLGALNNNRYHPFRITLVSVQLVPAVDH